MVKEGNSSFLRRKINHIKYDVKGLFSTIYACPECKMEIIRGEGFCDKCGHEFYEIKKINFIKKFFKMSFLSKIVSIFVLIFSLIFIAALIAVSIYFTIGG